MGTGRKTKGKPGHRNPQTAAPVATLSYNDESAHFGITWESEKLPKLILPEQLESLPCLGGTCADLPEREDWRYLPTALPPPYTPTGVAKTCAQAIERG